MSTSQKISSLTVGLAIFSMFFGSGNLVFPLYLGQLARDQWSTVVYAFCLTAIIGPFLGVLTMVLYRGKTEAFFSALPKPFSGIFVLLLTWVWIPLGAGPRCINVSYDTFGFMVEGIPQSIFILLYSLVVWIVIQNPSKMIKLLGYVLTPILLISLICLWVKGIWNAPEITETTVSSSKLFYEGVVYGYNTLDFIAGFFYSSSLIFMLQSTMKKQKEVLRKVFFAGTLSMLFLFLVYFSFIYLAAHYADLLEPLPLSRYIGFISVTLLGKQWAIIPVIAVTLACLTTSIAMTSTFGTFLYERYFKKHKKGLLYANIISLTSTLVVSLLGLEGLLRVIAPLLQILSHFLLILTVWNLVRRHYQREEIYQKNIM